MKSAINILILCSILTSCNFEKRLYRNGYFIQHSNHKNTEGVDLNSVKMLDQPFVNAIEQNVAADPEFVVAINVLPNSEKPTKVIKEHRKSPIDNGYNEKEFDTPVLPIHNEDNSNKHVQTKKSSSGNPDEGMPAQTMITLGWVFTGIAIVSLIVLWPLIFFLIPGLYFLIVGYKKRNGTGGYNSDGKKKSSSNELQDVVYLKNGSIIRGIIIEQVPNVSIKIQTGDGSVFFYKMEEIEKLTKEPAK